MKSPLNQTEPTITASHPEMQRRMKIAHKTLMDMLENQAERVGADLGVFINIKKLHLDYQPGPLLSKEMAGGSQTFTILSDNPISEADLIFNLASAVDRHT
jgi:hypothetical protein